MTNPIEIGVSKYYNLKDMSLQHTLVRFASSHDEINYVLSMINYAYIPYYIQETEKILKGKRDEFEIHITDDEEYDAPDDYIIVHKDMFYGKNEKEKTIETTQLLEFLKIMKKELSIGDDVVEDERCDLKNN